MNAVNLINKIQTAIVYGEPLENKQIQSLVHDTRQVSANSCFIAIRGERFDGHQAIEAVVAAGATVVIVEELQESWLQLPVSIVVVGSTFRAQAMLANAFYGEPSTKLNVVAITGTNGKTTTSSMISEWLMTLNRKTGLLGTLHYKVDQTYYPAVNTTPNALELQRLFNEMVEVGCDDAIIEASSHALQLGRLWYTDVDCAIFTNLTREHLDFHHTMQEYAFAKSLLFAQLGQQFHNGKPKVAIVNADDPYSHIMTQATAAEIVTYSTQHTNATVYATDIQMKQHHMIFILHDRDKEYDISLKMIGEYNVLNYLAAYCCLAYYYQIEPLQIIAAADKFNGVMGRTQIVDCQQPFQVVVDFAHTPDAIENVLSTVSSNKKGKLITLIGHSGGNRDSGARPEIGDIVFQYSDYIVFTADNPRHEPVQKICKELIGEHTEKDYVIIEDRIEAIHYALSIAQPNDSVVFAGKGGESYQVIGDEYVPFNEVEIIEHYLQQEKQ
ncbi:UDP-N-acetylmuramoyl-L-alanyl-D-glutamate--2,6-diaminopimelate ligase [Aerococcaceae bacterium zg-ZJ1578]|uniref:UDP-N-acetylmuramoyl-L-alanyl-D-glutamate--2, 6-diaminopimelate ligase n=1 Tax=Aerococcaceae bacterium zg-252 TaxID=2796928 RepID=UPI001A22947E|nr:UDP-N-acetylmuramoyl-L-alanyl-D-glutamate--2,6-diaminopimelate ligase [Aerococcaceae bacterium zg-1578]